MMRNMQQMEKGFFYSKHLCWRNRDKEMNAMEHFIITQ